MSTIQQLRNKKSNALEFYHHDRHAPQPLTYLAGFKILVTTWFFLTAGCAVGLHSALEIFWRGLYGVPGPLKENFLFLLLLITPVPYCAKYLLLTGHRWFIYQGFLLPGAASAWYPSRRRRFLIASTLSATGIIIPTSLILMNFTYAKSQSFSLFPWVVSFLGSQGFILAGIGAASVRFEARSGLGNTNIGDGQPAISPMNPPALNAVNDGIVITQLSDLHLTGGKKTLEGNASPDPQFEETLRLFGKHINESDLILITGDITDSGQPEEWTSFFSHYPSELLDKTIIIPGNHDINIAGPSIFHVNDPKLVVRGAKLVRMMMAIRFAQGEKAYVVDENDKIISLSAFLDRRLPELVDFLYSNHALDSVVEVDKFAQTPAEQRFSKHAPLPNRILALWNQIFPMAIPLNDGFTVYVFDTCKRNLSIVDNAFGELSASEKLSPLKRFDLLRSSKNFQKTSSLLAMHHHIVLPIKPKTFGRRIQARAMVMLDAPQVYQHLRNIPQSIVFHGHRHVHYLLSIEDKLQVISAPSTTLGDEFNNQGPGFYQYRITRERSKTRLAGVARYDLPVRAEKPPK